ncbi:MAG TPA: SDR family NAD(P)-dependent oxidoreductase [Actinomycetota bacterium]|nr:SDR family NAD(P)-dependent oxidoreductase [Actinomycetota bacterium]
MGQLDGKIALVTGAASGIGRATAQRFAAEGARVAILDLAEDAGRACADEIGGFFAVADVSDPDSLSTAVGLVVERFGGLDIAHLNAGVGERNVDIDSLDEKIFARAVGVNVAGVVFGTKAAASAMTHGGAIVATSSLAGLVPYPSDPIYGLTKHAVVGFVRSAAEQLAQNDIRINAICPGFVETAMLVEMVPAFRDSGFPLLQPEEVADAVLTIATGDATGEVFVCQPGRTCELYGFRGVPGPRVEGAEGMRPPTPG